MKTFFLINIADSTIVYRHFMTTGAQSLQFKELSEFNKKAIFAKTRTDFRE